MAADAVNAALFLIELREHGRKAVHLSGLDQRSVLRNRHDRKVKDRAVLRPHQQTRLHPVFLDHLRKVAQDAQQDLPLGRAQLSDRLFALAAGAAGKLPAYKRRQSLEMAEQPAVQSGLLVCRLNRSGQSRLRDLQQADLVLCRRQMIEQSGENAPLGSGVVSLNPADGVQNAAVLAVQNQVGVFAHQFDGEILFARHTHLVDRVALDDRETLEIR